MNRVAFRMRLKEGFKEEYKRRHDEIWPEITELLKKEGISNYSIFFDDSTGFLFGFQILRGENNSQGLSQNPTVKRWWDYMADIMEVNEDNSPKTLPLKELFYME